MSDKLRNYKRVLPALACTRVEMDQLREDDFQQE